MCGISGIIKPGIEAQNSVIKLMVSRLDHRGPDASGCVQLAGCHLGHNRLSVIDLNTGDQPMSYADGRFWITFNGEIYNYRQLQKELLSSGYGFRTQSDTEVIIASFLEWGPGCLDKFRGMFAFAIWDTRERRLFAARDIFGEKPFYYGALADGSMLFASEIKAITASGIISPRLNLDSVDAYLALGYVPPYKCIYENIQVLPPGHFMYWEAGKITVKRYWIPRFQTRDVSLEDAGQQLLGLLKQAVKRQSVADVPVGAFLSGGLDSSTVVALLQQQLSEPIKTFSVGFGNSINELPYARLVAKRYRTEHHEIDLGEPPVAELFEQLGTIHDEPFADLSNIPTYLISQYARRFVKVVLSGDGGDEIFGGYTRYPKILMSERASGSRAKWIVLRLMSRLIQESNRKLTVYSVAEGLACRWKDIWLRGAMFNIHLKAEERRKLWADRYVNIGSFSPNGYHFPPQEITGLNRVFFYDLTSYLPGDILVKVDRAAMACGLETRAPLLDRDLAEFSLSLPFNLKVDKEKTKIVLKNAVSQFWPEEIKGRRKEGFSLPAQRWLKRPDMQALQRRIFRKNSPLRYLLPGLNTEQGALLNYNTWILLTFGVWLENQGVSV